MVGDSGIMTTEEMLKMFPMVGSKKNSTESDEAIKEWLKQRHGKFTASTFHKLFTAKYTLSKSATAQTYIKEKAAETFGAFNEQANSASLRWGNEHEPEAIEFYEKIKGVKVDSSRGFKSISDHCGATPDGYILDNQGKDTNRIVQIKCPYTVQKHLEYLTYKSAEDLKENNKEYYVQVNYEMYVTGATVCDFASYDKRFPDAQKMAIVEVPRDLELIEKIKEALSYATETKLAYVEKASNNKF